MHHKEDFTRLYSFSFRTIEFFFSITMIELFLHKDRVAKGFNKADLLNCIYTMHVYKHDKLYPRSRPSIDCLHSSHYVAKGECYDPTRPRSG